MRARYAGGADRRPAQNDSRCGWDTRKVRRRSAAYSGPARARGRCGRRLPQHPWDRRQDCRPTFEPLRSNRKITADSSRRTARSRTALQEARDPPHHAALFKKGEDVRWRGPTPAFAEWAKRMEAPRLLERCEKAA